MEAVSFTLLTPISKQSLLNCVTGGMIRTLKEVYGKIVRTQAESDLCMILTIYMTRCACLHPQQEQAATAHFEARQDDAVIERRQALRDADNGQDDPPPPSAVQAVHAAASYGQLQLYVSVAGAGVSAACAAISGLVCDYTRACVLPVMLCCCCCCCCCCVISDTKDISLSAHRQL
jgi:hypothetical protein